MSGRPVDGPWVKAHHNSITPAPNRVPQAKRRIPRVLRKLQWALRVGRWRISKAECRGIAGFQCPHSTRRLPAVASQPEGAWGRARIRVRLQLPSDAAWAKPGSWRKPTAPRAEERSTSQAHGFHFAFPRPVTAAVPPERSPLYSADLPLNRAGSPCYALKYSSQ